VIRFRAIMLSISVRGKDSRWPTDCPCCGLPADSTLKSHWTLKQTMGASSVYHTKSLKVPYCSVCTSHIPLGMANAMILSGAVGAISPIPFLVDSHTTQFEFLLYAVPAGLGGVLLVWGILSVVNWFRAKKVTSKCIGVERAVQLSFQPNTDFVTLTFTDDRYGDRFSAMNADNRTY